MNDLRNIKQQNDARYRDQDMNLLNHFKKQVCAELSAVYENHETAETIEDFERLVRAIRERPLKSIEGFWFNLVEYRGHHFIQGDLRKEASPHGDFTPVAALVDGPGDVDIEGFWPEVRGYPISGTEADLIASYLTRQGKNDVELIVPERNTARPVACDRFDESPEFETYKKFIYPAVIEAIETIEAHRDKLKAFL
jgi:hypothetical protein